jgi:hypothetical protein
MEEQREMALSMTVKKSSRATVHAPSHEATAILNLGDQTQDRYYKQNSNNKEAKITKGILTKKTIHVQTRKSALHMKILINSWYCLNNDCWDVTSCVTTPYKFDAIMQLDNIEMQSIRK